MSRPSTPASLPFPAFISLPRGLLSFGATLVVHGEASEDFHVDAWSLVATFTDAASWGAFWALGGAPERSTLSILDHGPLQPGVHSFSLEAKELAPEAWRLLLAMFVQVHSLSQPWQYLELIAAGTHEHPLTLPELLSAPPWQPLAPPNFPFALSLPTLTGAQAQHLVGLEHLRPLADQDFEILAERLENWDMLIMLGAFTPLHEHLEDFPITPGRTYQLSSRRVEHAFEGSLPFVGAVEVLQHLALSWHREGHELEAFELE